MAAQKDTRGAGRRGQRTGQMQGAKAQADQAQVWSPPQTPGLTLMRASFRTQSFARHSHEGYGVGVIERGALGFSYRGAGLVGPQGARRGLIAGLTDLYAGGAATVATQSGAG